MKKREISRLREKVMDLEGKLGENEIELRAKHEMWLRAVADFDNFRKRREKEIQSVIRLANEKIILELLDVIDGMETGLSLVGKEENVSPLEGTNENAGLKEGLTLVLSKLKKILELEGVREVNPLGKEFDPQFCEAVMEVSESGFTPNHVVEVMRKGYTLGDKLLRPARVKVAK